MAANNRNNEYDIEIEDDGAEENLYEIPDFMRQQHQRPFCLQQQQPNSFSSGQRQQPYRSSLHVMTANHIIRQQQQQLETISRAREQQQQPSQKRKVKPNTLPVLNCLFAALNNNSSSDNGGEDDTPYVDVPATPTTVYYHGNGGFGKRGIGSSYTQDDLR